MNKALLHGLTASVAMVLLPHVEHMPPWVSAASAAVLLWRVLWTQQGRKPPRLFWLWSLSLLGAAGIVVEFDTVFGREAGVAFLALLTSMKLLELHATRDVLVTLFLACFLCITGFFYSQSIPIALYLLLTLLVILSTWLGMQMPTASAKVRWQLAGSMLLKALPLTLVLFLLFPRVQGPLWGMPSDAYSSSGLSDSMSPGSLSKLILSDAVAFRVSYDGPAPPRSQMYWRGPVLWEFDGRTWTPGSSAFRMPPQITPLSQPLHYQVTLEPHNQRWLFALDVPTHFNIPVQYTEDLQTLYGEPLNQRLRYQADSALRYQFNVQELVPQLRRATGLPDDEHNLRSRELAASWRKAHADDAAAIVQAALRYFNQQGFVYTLEPPPLGVDGVDDFLFRTKRGFCEHYASAFVVLMRAAGVPSRVVTGYLGGEWNDLGKYHVVRQSDAHAWAEVWLEGRGWVRIDPTAAIAPERVQRTAARSAADNAAAPYMARNPPDWLRNLRVEWDFMTNQWNQWVLGYDSERQFDFLTRMGMDVTWQNLAGSMGAAVMALLGLFAAWMMRDLWPARRDPVQQHWHKLSTRLGKVGLPRADYETASDYARRVAQARPELAAAMQQVASEYNRLRYETTPDATSLRAWQQQVQQLLRRIAKIQ